MPGAGLDVGGDLGNPRVPPTPLGGRGRGVRRGGEERVRELDDLAVDAGDLGGDGRLERGLCGPLDRALDERHGCG